MKLSVPLRFGSSLAFWFSLLCLLPVMEGSEPVLALMLGLAILGAGLSAAFDRPWVRIPAALAAVLPLLLLRKNGFVLALAAPWPLWFCLRLITDRLHVEYWQWKRPFAVIGFASLIVLLSNVTFGALRPWCMAFAALVLLLGMMALRLLRMGGAADLRWAGWSTLELLSPLLAAGLCAAVLYPVVLLLRPVLALLMSGVGYGLHGMTSFFGQIFGTLSEGEKFGEDLYDPYVSADTQPAAQELKPVTAPVSGGGTNWDQILAVVILVLLALGLILLLIRRMRLRSKVAASDETAPYETGTRFLRRRARRRKAVPSSNAERIRAIYRDYLGLLQKRGLVLRKSTTSAEVLTQTGREQEEDEALRGLYLRSRYGNDAAVRAEEVLEAQTLLDKLRRELE